MCVCVSVFVCVCVCSFPYFRDLCVSVILVLSVSVLIREIVYVLVYVLLFQNFCEGDTRVSLSMILTVGVCLSISLCV